MSLWRVRVEEPKFGSWIVFVLANTERGARRIATRTVSEDPEDKAHSIEAIQINPFITGALLSLRENDVMFVREEVPSG